MGVFDGWFGKRSDDPLKDLDPKVREFLKKESPVKLDSKEPAGQDGNKSAVASQATTDVAQTGAVPENAVPKESLYQDGRYAHLWKTYRPLADIENETKSDQERLGDVLDAYKSRKAAIGLAALENCAEEQLDWNNCMKSGSLKARMTMCRDEVRKFERCYNMQSRLLKALGYLNQVERSPELDEKLQLHADKLYHQMLEQDEAIENAQKEGKPIPKFEAVIPKQVTTVEMSEAAKKRLQEQLEKLDEKDRATEQAAVEAEMRSKAEMVNKIQNLWKEQEAQRNAEREARRQRGEETLWDKAATLFNSSSGSSDGTSDGKKS